MEVIVFGDIEDVLSTYLEGRLADYSRAVPVSVTVPNPRPDEFVTVRRTGGPRRDLVTDAPILAVECWAELPSEALSLAQLARGLINEIPGSIIGGLTVYRVVEAAGPALLPDPESNQARYTFTVQLDVRGSAQEEGVS